MSPSKFLSVGVILLAISSSAFADEGVDGCSAVALYSDDGVYESCQVSNGDQISFQDAESTPEEACAITCSAMAEINAMADESRELDAEAGF